MDAMSTNALIACLRALIGEVSRTEQALASDDLDDDEAEELGHHLADLQEALAAASEAYERRRGQDAALTPVERLLAHFSREAGA